MVCSWRTGQRTQWEKVAKRLWPHCGKLRAPSALLDPRPTWLRVVSAEGSSFLDPEKRLFHAVPAAVARDYMYSFWPQEVLSEAQKHMPGSRMAPLRRPGQKGRGQPGRPLCHTMYSAVCEVQACVSPFAHLTAKVRLCWNRWSEVAALPGQGLGAEQKAPKCALSSACSGKTCGR